VSPSPPTAEATSRCGRRRRSGGIWYPVRHVAGSNVAAPLAGSDGADGAGLGDVGLEVVACRHAVGCQHDRRDGDPVDLLADDVGVAGMAGHLLDLVDQEVESTRSSHDGASEAVGVPLVVAARPSSVDSEPAMRSAPCLVIELRKTRTP